MRPVRLLLCVGVALGAGLGVLVACAQEEFGQLSAGETCSASSQCGPGLVCNFGVDPPVCAGNLTVEPPAADAAEVDAAAADAAVVDAALPDAAVPDAMPDAT